MNNTRRNQIAKLTNHITEVISVLEDICTEEQESFDSMPEGLQEGDNGQASQEAIDNMESAQSDLEAALGSLEEII